MNRKHHALPGDYYSIGFVNELDRVLARFTIDSDVAYRF